MGSEGDKFKELQDESVTNWDVFRKFPSAKPSLAHILGLLPAIKPRLYSIANSSDYTPDCVELTIVINQWQPKAGKDKALKTGIATQYVQSLPVGSRVAVAMTHGTFTFPKDDMTPMVMTGLYRYCAYQIICAGSNVQEGARKESWTHGCVLRLSTRKRRVLLQGGMETISRSWCAHSARQCIQP